MPPEAYRPGADDAAALPLRTAVCAAGHPHTSPEYFDCAFSRNPSGRSSAALLWHAGIATSLRGLAPKPIWLDGRQGLIAAGFDYLVRPDTPPLLKARTAFRIVVKWAEIGRSMGAAFGTSFPNESSF